MKNSFKPGQVVRGGRMNHRYLVISGRGVGWYQLKNLDTGRDARQPALNLELIGNNYQAKQKCSR